MTVNWYGVPFWSDENVVDSGDGGTTLLLYQKPLNIHFRG